MLYTKTGKKSYSVEDDTTIQDEGFAGWVAKSTTRPEDNTSVFGQALLKLAQAHLAQTKGHNCKSFPKATPLLLTTEEWVEGYSDYTIEDTWGAVVLTLPHLQWEYRWDNVAELLTDLAAVEAVNKCSCGSRSYTMGSFHGRPTPPPSAS